MKVIFVISLFLAGLTTYFFLFTTPATNYNTAFIDKYEKGYKVTVKGKRVLMANDPVSAFLRKTYEDSIVFIIPKNDGVIQSNEIQISQDRYKPTGTITIKEQKMTIALYYDDKQTDADTWNGKYNLILK